MKIKKEERGIAVAMGGFFGALTGLGIFFLGAQTIGVAIVQLSIIIGIAGVLINFWIIYHKRKR